MLVLLLLRTLIIAELRSCGAIAIRLIELKVTLLSSSPERLVVKDRLVTL
jgi:hypothetical protein